MEDTSSSNDERLWYAQVFLEKTTVGLRVDQYSTPDACLKAVQKLSSDKSIAALVTVDVLAAGALLQFLHSPFERARLEHKTRAEYVPEQMSSGSGVHSKQPHKNYTIALCVPLAAPLERFDSVIARPPDSKRVLQHWSHSQSAELSESNHSSQSGVAPRDRGVCLTPQRVLPDLNELLVSRENWSCGQCTPVSSVPAWSSFGEDLQMPVSKPTPYSSPQMQSISPIRPNAIIAQMHTSTTTASSSQSTSLQVTGQVQQPQANSLAHSGRQAAVSALVAAQCPESATASFYKTEDKAVQTEPMEVNLCEVREYYPEQTEPVYVPEPFPQEDTSDDSFVSESTTEILWVYKQGTCNGVKVDRSTTPDACVKVLQSWCGDRHKAALVTVDVHEACLRLEVLQRVGSPFERARLVREMRATAMLAQKSRGSSGHSIGPHEYHTILLPVPQNLLEMNLFASCTPWFPRIHVSENREVSPPQNSTRSDSRQTSVERLLSEKRAALSDKSAANFQKNVRAAIMELLVPRENSSCGSHVAFSSQSTSSPLTQRAQMSMREPQVFTVRPSGRLIPVPAPVATQWPAKPTAAFSQLQSARETLPIETAYPPAGSGSTQQVAVARQLCRAVHMEPVPGGWKQVSSGALYKAGRDVPFVSLVLLPSDSESAHSQPASTESKSEAKSDGSGASHTKKSAAGLLKKRSSIGRRSVDRRLESVTECSDNNAESDDDNSNNEALPRTSDDVSHPESDY